MCFCFTLKILCVLVCRISNGSKFQSCGPMIEKEFFANALLVGLCYWILGYIACCF